MTLVAENAMKHNTESAKAHTECRQPPSTEAGQSRPTSPARTAPQLHSDDRIAAAAYIAEMAATLAELARGHGFRVLGQTLDISRLEAEQLAQRRASRRNATAGPAEARPAAPVTAR
jgi:hypothetical protein